MCRLLLEGRTLRVFPLAGGFCGVLVPKDDLHGREVFAEVLDKLSQCDDTTFTAEVAATITRFVNRSAAHG